MSSRKSRGASREVSAPRDSLPRELRSSSPVKQSHKDKDISSRPKATPRKPRVKKTAASSAKDQDRASTPASVADSADELGDEAQRDATSQVNGKSEVDDSLEVDGTEEPEESEPLPENTVRVSVQSEVQDNGELQTTHTTVKVEVPANSPDLELPKDTEGVVEVAKEIIENMKEMQAAKIEGSLPLPSSAKSKKSLKRSRDEYEEDLEGPEELVEELVEAVDGAEELDGVNEEELQRAKEEHRPAKRVRIMVSAEEYRREKVRGRALLGLGGAFAVGYVTNVIMQAIANIRQAPASCHIQFLCLGHRIRLFDEPRHPHSTSRLGCAIFFSWLSVSFSCMALVSWDSFAI